MHNMLSLQQIHVSKTL